MVDFDEIRKEVAIKHNVLLSQNDPILVTVTLHDLVLRRYVELLTAQNEGHQRALSAALAEHIERSKAVGGRIITDAADYVSRQVHAAVTSALTDTAQKLKSDLDAAHTARRESANLVAEARSARSMAITAARLSLICAVAAIIMMAIAFAKLS